MVFSSLLFMFRFLPAVLVLYFICPARFRNVILFLFSLFFYAWGEPKYVLLMLCSVTVDFFLAKVIEKRKEQKNQKGAKRALALSIIYNISVLGFFKYADFLIGSVNGIFGSSIPLLHIPLPIGISFFTFQTMSYTIDVYRGETKVQKSWLKYGTYVSMFPQLIAGPIVQYKTIAWQMDNRKETMADFSHGLQRFMTGVGKKVLLANNIGKLWTEISMLGSGSMPALTAWIGALAYTMQLYYDFSGYSDMAIGLGEMFGFHFLENFNYPYISRSITEFWRRWHISLSSWFREYVYIPLGGNRCGLLRQVRNIAIVWMLTGIWHGASWNFVLWGVYYGILLILEKFVLKDLIARLPGAAGSVYTMLFVIIGWVIFAFDGDVTGGLGFLKTMFGGYGNGLADGNTIYYFYTNISMFIILILGSTQLPKKAAEKVLAKLGETSQAATLLRLVFVGGIFFLSVAYLVDASYNPFLYFRF